MLEFIGGWITREILGNPFTEGEETIEYKTISEDKRKCDFCNKGVDEDLGSGLLCAGHYYKQFPEKLDEVKY